jgi:hypothetical protein
MSVKVKIKHVFDHQTTLVKVSMRSFPAVIAFRISKAMRAVNDEVAAFEKIRTDLIKANGVRTEGTDDWIVKPDKQNEIGKQIEDLLEEEFVIDVTPIDIKLFEKIEISAAEITALEFMIDGEL